MSLVSRVGCVNIPKTSQHKTSQHGTDVDSTGQDFTPHKTLQDWQVQTKWMAYK